MGSLFSEVTALVATGAGHFDADVSGDWTIGGKPNGGYLLAMLGRAAAATGVHPHVIAASAHYLRPPEPGPVAIEATLLRSGRSADQLRARMVQDGLACVEALVTTATLPEAAAPSWSAGLPRPPAAGRDRCVRLPGRTPVGTPVPMMEQVDVRIDPDDLGFAAGRPSGRGELRGWLQLPADEPFDPAGLLFAVDAFPPATFEIEPTGWVPTLELTAYVRALPAPGPVRVLHRAQLVSDRRVDEASFVWDAAGTLVAQATQLAGVRIG